MNKTHLGVIATVFHVALMATANANAFRIVAYSGQQAPGEAAGVTFQSLNQAPVINNHGLTAFTASLNGDLISDGGGPNTLWSEGGGSLAVVTKDGDAAPGVAGGTLAGFTNPHIADNGQVAFSSGALGQTGRQ